MPEFVHTFQNGKMNKDLDERLVPNGQYRDALNLDLANSEGSNVGALQNVKGNVELRGKANDLDGWQASYIEDLSNPVCIGSIRNDIDEKIYWFIASDSVSAIAELDTITGYIHPILVDKNNILKFSKDYLITGINIIDKFLFWTDDQTEPKRININKFKAGSCDFNTHTKIPEWNPSQDNYTEVNCGFVGATEPDFTEEDVTVIKKSPLTAPTINAAASPFGANIAGTGITPVYAFADQPIIGQTTGFENFTYLPSQTSLPNFYESLPTYGEYLANTTGPDGNPNHYANSNLPAGWDGRVTITLESIYGTDPITGESVWQVNDIIFLQGSDVDDFNETFEYQVTIKIKTINNLVITGEIQAISSDILKFVDESGNPRLISWEIILEERDPMYEYLFPRFAYRWKYIDNEYSCFSPFSEVAFVGDRFKYPSSDGHNIGMTNNIRKLIIESLTAGSDEVDEIEILYKESNNTAIYSVDSIKKKDFAPYSTTAGALPTIFEIKSEIIGSVLQPNQILRPWDNVPRVAKSQEIIGNRIIYGNYLQNYTVDPTLKLDISSVNLPHPANAADTTLEEIQLQEGMPKPSIKTIRTYQAGVVFKDEYGRETPVFTNKNASIKLEVENSDNLNKILVQPNSPPPSFATHYKFFIKETSNEYYNLALDRFYLAEDGNVWLSFPSSERNKVDEETYLILKKQHDNNVAIDSLLKYKILSIQNEAPEYVKAFENVIASGQVDNLGGFEPGFIQISYKTDSEGLRDPQNYEGDNVIEITKGGTTDKYLMTSGGYNSTSLLATVNLERPLGQDAAFLIGQTDATVRIYKNTIKNKPEFEGRFFVKINRDFAFDTNIIASFAAMEPSYGIIADVLPRLQGGQPVASGNIVRDDSGNAYDYKCGWFFKDNGETDNGWALDNCASRYKALDLNNVGSNISQQVRETFGMPRTLGKNIGLNFIGPRNRMEEWGNNATTGSVAGGKTFHDTIGPGSLIRIKMFDGQMTEPYIVERVHKQDTNRGKIETGRSSCSNTHSSDGNKKTVIGIELRDKIVETFVGDGGNAALKLIESIELVRPVISDGNKLLSSANPAIFETEPKEAVDLDLYYEASDALPIANYNLSQTHLNYYNCFSFGQGVESNRIRDDFNAVTIDKGPKVSAPLDEPYAAERRGNGLIFSQIFNSTSGINRLNQFIQAEPITKDLNPTYGTIQKLHTRQTDLLSLCEDKVVKILANKDALFNADGNVNLTGNTAVLGQAMVPATFGEFGISKNPESFAADNYRIYFADKNRGAVLRLSMNGIVNIADKGMTDFFADNLKVSNKIVGSFDKEKDLYNLTLDALSQQWQNTFNTSQTYQLNPDCNAGSITASLEGTTISFKEMIDGWTSRKSFTPESGISLNNLYYTFKDGRIYEHGLNVAANNFYRVQYESSLNLLINEQPNIVKGYSTINYTGTRSRRLEYKHGQKFYSIAEINALQVIPTSVQQKTPGWYVNYIKTDLEGGEVKEFEKKEGKYFNYIKGLEIFNDCDVIGDGIGNPDIIDADPQNYILTFTIDPTCSDTGSTTPNTMQYFVNIWNNFKQDVQFFLNIESITTSAQDVKCAIENLYNTAYSTQNYTGTQNSGTLFSYVFSDGLQVGTQMYNHLTNEAITQAGAYLFVNTPADQTSDIVDHAGLDPNNPAAVPVSYYVMILGGDGKIASYTQYNTLSVCNNTQEPLGTKFLFNIYSSQERPVANPPVNVITPYYPQPTDTNNEIICKNKTALDEFNASPLPYPAPNPGDPFKSLTLGGTRWRWYDSTQGGTDNIQLGTIIRDSNGSPQTYAQVGIYSGGPPVFPTIGSWADITVWPSYWYIVKTNTSGEVIVFQQINQLTNPTCP